MDKYIFTLEVIAEMLGECLGSGNDDENGGVLAGPKSNPYLVTDIIPSSSYAERAPATYFQNEQDVNFINGELRRLQAMGKDFIGYYHRHPSGLDRLSQGDLGTCHDILTSPNYAINNRLLMVIVTKGRAKMPIYGYNVSLTGEQAMVKSVKIKAMPGKCIKACFEGIDINHI